MNEWMNEWMNECPFTWPIYIWHSHNEAMIFYIPEGTSQKQKHNSYWVHVQILVQYKFQNNQILYTYTLSIYKRIVSIYMYELIK